MAEPEIFYHREEQWQKPVLSRPGERPDPFLRHIVMRLPGERQAEFILMVPFTPRGKDNLASWMVARNDGEHYGRLVLYRLPKQSLVYGPTQIVNRINQDTDISRQISLWDQRGSEVIRGNLRSEEHTSELQSPCNLVCRLLLEKKKKCSNANDQR